ncbi:hypothetical protein VARIO8X_130061 [Burkholderiales bacterium 8X]|nr:hypothetical protein VARIO8X_130061 [Burkholderiales bacterium 8X]
MRPARCRGFVRETPGRANRLRCHRPAGRRLCRHRAHGLDAGTRASRASAPQTRRCGTGLRQPRLPQGSAQPMPHRAGGHRRGAGRGRPGAAPGDDRRTRPRGRPDRGRGDGPAGTRGGLPGRTAAGAGIGIHAREPLDVPPGAAGGGRQAGDPGLRALSPVADRAPGACQRLRSAVRSRLRGGAQQLLAELGHAVPGRAARAFRHRQQCRQWLPSLKTRRPRPCRRALR